jgi:S-methylmethionine-dependent homocysteine/selenocysteine methylase
MPFDGKGKRSSKAKDVKKAKSELLYSHNHSNIGKAIVGGCCITRESRIEDVAADKAME